MGRPSFLLGLLPLVVAAACADRAVSEEIGTSQAALVTTDAIVISQVYGGGGNSGAPYSYDYVELFNRGTTDAVLKDASLQYAGATSTT
jgi:hypothetical protein